MRAVSVKNYKMKNNPIGIFDSGLGGLTVLSEVARLLPTEETIYLGDTARVPYGIKSKETVVRYALEDAAFLQSHKVKLIVAACNTASANALDILQKVLNVPVIGVIEPGARAAVKATKTGRIGIIGTSATIDSNAYTSAIVDLAPEAKTFALACPLFVPLVEEGWNDNEIALSIAKKYLVELQEADIDTLVLGCTHYPLLKGIIAKVMGPGVTLIDSAAATATVVSALLEKEGIKNSSGSNASHAFFVTDSPDNFVKVGTRFFGKRLNCASLAELERRS